MGKVTSKKYVEGVESIYTEQPVYEEGHDGSDGKCDCIGMCRGGLKRAGATGVTNMRGTNQAARKAIDNLHELAKNESLSLGDVVLRVRDKDDPSMPLPDKYRKGGSEYDPNVGEINFTHIGTVTKTNPIEITHMTSPTAKKDKSIKGWTYSGKLPWVEYDPDPEPTPEQEPPQTEWAIVVAENGNNVKMRAEPTQSCKLWWPVPVGDEVMVYDWDAATDKKGQAWSRIRWAGQDGYMLREFLRDEDEEVPPLNPDDHSGLWTVTISGLTFEQAEQLCMDWSDASMKRG